MTLVVILGDQRKGTTLIWAERRLPSALPHNGPLKLACGGIWKALRVIEGMEWGSHGLYVKYQWEKEDGKEKDVYLPASSLPTDNNDSHGQPGEGHEEQDFVFGGATDVLLPATLNYRGAALRKLYGLPNWKEGNGKRIKERGGYPDVSTASLVENAAEWQYPKRDISHTGRDAGGGFVIDLPVNKLFGDSGQRTELEKKEERGKCGYIKKWYSTLLEYYQNRSTQQEHGENTEKNRRIKRRSLQTIPIAYPTGNITLLVPEGRPDLLNASRLYSGDMFLCTGYYVNANVYNITTGSVTPRTATTLVKSLPSGYNISKVVEAYINSIKGMSQVSALEKSGLDAAISVFPDRIMQERHKNGNPVSSFSFDPRIRNEPSLLPLNISWGGSYKDVVELFGFSPVALIVKNSSYFQSADSVVQTFSTEFGDSSRSFVCGGHLYNNALHLAHAEWKLTSDLINFFYLPFDTSEGALEALLNDEIDAVWITGRQLLDIFGLSIYSTAKPSTTKYEAKHFSILGIASGRRLDAVPDSPTFVEQDIPLVQGEYLGISFPPGVDSLVRAEAEKRFDSIQRNIKFSSRLLPLAIQPLFVDSESFLSQYNDFVSSIAPNLCFYTANNGKHLFEQFRVSYRIAPGGVLFASFYAIIFLIITCFSFYYARFRVLPHIKLYHPHLKYIRRTLSNFLHLISVLLEGIQLNRVALSGDHGIRWGSGFETAMSLADIEVQAVWFYWLVFTISLAFLLYELMFFLRLERYLESHRVGHIILFPSIYCLRFIGTVAYIPTLFNLLKVFSCRYMDAIDEASITSMCDIQCWVPIHWSMVISSALVLILFVPSILLTAHIWQETSNGLDIKYDPTHFLYVYIVKLAMVIFRIFFKPFVVPFYLVLVGLCSFMVVRIYLYRPCFMEWINLYRGLSWFIAGFTSLTLLIMYLVDFSNGKIAMWILVSSWLFFFIITEIYSRIKYPVKLTAAAALKKYSQTKMAYLVQSVARPSLLAKVSHMRASATLSMDKINQMEVNSQGRLKPQCADLRSKLCLAGIPIEETSGLNNINEDEILQSYLRNFHSLSEAHQWAVIEAYMDGCVSKYSLSKKDLLLLEEACVRKSTILKDMFVALNSDTDKFMANLNGVLELIDIGIQFDLEKHHIHSLREFEKDLANVEAGCGEGGFLDSLKEYEEEDGDHSSELNRHRVSTVEFVEQSMSIVSPMSQSAQIGSVSVLDSIADIAGGESQESLEKGAFHVDRPDAVGFPTDQNDIDSGGEDTGEAAPPKDSEIMAESLSSVIMEPAIESRTFTERPLTREKNAEEDDDIEAIDVDEFPIPGTQ
eukprot:Nk52_evm20s913 gene=Nk52_evmTU20s913